MARSTEKSGPAGPRRPHRESLLRIPLLRLALADPTIRLSPRAVDCRWVYERLVRTSVAGFNPFSRRLFHGARSRLADWLAAPSASARPHNERDHLVREALFLVHDHLHAWSAAVIDELRPELGFGYAPITERNVETFAFCHLLTEAAATIGLDYWYLCTVDLHEVCDVGTGLGALTTSYHERWRAEYQRFDPLLEVQRPGFFGQLARFYCTGTWPGLGVDDLRASPRLLGWLEHELRYGQTQREHIRDWLRFLSGTLPPCSRKEAAAPVACDDAPWKQALTEDLGTLLWERVKKGEAHRPARDDGPPQAWASPPDAPLDGRFLNVNTLDERELRARAPVQDATSFHLLVDQYVSGFDLASFDRDKLKLLPAVRELRDIGALIALCRGERRVEPVAWEPRDLFVLP